MEVEKRRGLSDRGAAGMLYLEVTLSEVRVSILLVPATREASVRLGPLDSVVVHVRSKEELDFEACFGRGGGPIQKCCRIDVGNNFRGRIREGS